MGYEHYLMLDNSDKNNLLAFMYDKVGVTGLHHGSKAVMRRCISFNAELLFDFIVSIGHGSDCHDVAAAAVGPRTSMIPLVADYS